MEAKDLVLGDVQAPPPLETLQREIIHPDNIALEARMRRAEILSLRNVFSLRLERRKLRKVWYEWQSLSDEKQRLEQMIVLYQERKSELWEALTSAHDQSLELFAFAWIVFWGKVSALPLLKKRAESAHSQRFQIVSQMETIRPQAMEYHRIHQTLEAYDKAKARKREEDKTIADAKKEAVIFGQLIRGVWANIKGCHHIDSQGKKETPHFSDVEITPTTIWFKIDASRKLMFGFKPALPYNVEIHSLIDERTILNIQTTIQRRTSAVVTHKGVWLRVDRLDGVLGIRDILHYRELMEHYPTFIHQLTPVCIGVGAENYMKWIPLADFPHLLVGGETGSGKSNLLNSIISMLIKHNTPQELRFAMVDLKGGLEFGHFETIPHMIGEPIQSLDKAVTHVAAVEAEMNRRFALLRSKFCKRLETYNARVSEEHRLPRIIIVFDEFASIKNQNPYTGRILDSIRLISQKGRAAGIHLIICTQHPDALTIPSEIKTNLVVRISGRMGTASASVTILGTGDAAQLPDIKGRVMLKIGAIPEQVQTQFITEEDITDAIKHAAQWPKPDDDLLAEVEAVTHQHWTPERLIDYSLKHKNGNVSGVPLYNDLKDEMSRSQVFELVEKIWAMDSVEHGGKTYAIVKRGKGKYLEEVKESA